MFRLRVAPQSDMLAASVFLGEFNCRLFLTVPDQKKAYHGLRKLRSLGLC